jgi:diguanylate cyclase
MTSETIADGARIAALRDLGILDTEPEEDFDRFTRLATELLGVPVSLVSLIAGDRQFFKSQQGLPELWADARQTPLSHSFCQHAVKSRKPLVVEDARESPLLSDNLAVRDLDVIAYAGMPLVLDDGHAVGVLCAIDSKPRHWSERDLRILEDLTAAVKTLLDLRSVLAKQSLHDRLTGLPNRTLTMAHCEQLLTANRDRQMLVVMTAGIDGFSLINEAYGVDEADCVLRAISQRLTGLLRKDDVLGRLQGDVFTILCPSVLDERDALELAQRIRDGVSAEPLTVGGDSLSASVTVGIASGGSGTDAGDLIARAAEAMRQAKSRHARVMVAEDGYASLVAARLRLRGALHRAVARGELSVAFQAIVDLKTGQPKAFEALARWTHPVLGTITPGDFIPIAEASGYVIEIGEHVLRTACHQLTDWRRNFDETLQMTVNLSPLQLAQPNIADLVQEILDQHRLPGDALTLEITEGVLLSPGALEQRNFMRLRDLGIQIALDDFGTGYSALGFLKRFPVDVIKTDRSFIESVESDHRDAALMQAILTMGEGMGIPVIAEGIETPTQRELLQKMGFRYGQGYLFARPLPAAEIHFPASAYHEKASSTRARLI